MLQEPNTSSAGSLVSRHEVLFLDYLQLESFGVLQMLHLQHATVIIADNVGDAKNLKNGWFNRWSIQKKREVAEKVRSKLLGPKGGKVLAAESKTKQEMREKEKEAREAEDAVRRAERAERKTLEEARKAFREERRMARTTPVVPS